jgi:glycosyltransferase involved in cell wall biosynthesis
MRILMFSNNYKPKVGGVITSITLCRRGLIRSGHDVHLVAPEYDDYEDEEPYTYRVPALSLPGDLDVSLALPIKQPMGMLVKGIKPHVIHSHQPLWLGALAASFAADLRTPLVYTFHTRYDAYAEHYLPMMPKLAGRTTSELVQRYLSRCSHVVAPTASIRDFLRSEYEFSTPLTVVPTPVDPDAFNAREPAWVRQELGLEGAEMLLYVGRLANEKGVDLLLHAFGRVAAERPQARLVLVGIGAHESQMRQLGRELGVYDRVIFCGKVPHAQVLDYFASADLFLFGSETDTQGLVMMEAMAAGTPVLAAKAPGAIDVLAEGGGLLLPAKAEAFATEIIALLSDGPRRQNLGQEARQAVRRFSLSATADRLTTVYETAVAAGYR